MPRVLFVSKPIVAPFHDGTKCLVRDVAQNLERFEPVVMSTRSAPALGGRVHSAAVYATAGRFAPAFTDNLRAALHLLHARADIWHFVFAPNPRTSLLSGALKRLRRVPVVQTVASPPRHFARIAQLLFGDIVVAQSRWTANRIAEAWQREAVPEARRPRLEVVWPSVPELAPRSAELIRDTRRELEIAPEAPLFVYPGDLETGGGAERVARLVEPLARELPGAAIVFAYREKTEATAEVADKLRARLDPRSTRLSRALPDVLALIAGATAVLFPVDDLWGKVDLPIVLLESMKLGVPVIALDSGPLSDLEGVRKVAGTGEAAWLGAALELARDPALRAQLIESQKRAVERRHRAETVARAYEGLYTELLR